MFSYLTCVIFFWQSDLTNQNGISQPNSQQIRGPFKRGELSYKYSGSNAEHDNEIKIMKISSNNIYEKLICTATGTGTNNFI
jgi:hypothetical protein